MSLGTVYDTNAGNPNLGIQFTIQPSSGSGNYELHIYAKPADYPGGTFTGSGVDTWYFSVENLVATSDPSGEITSWDASFTPVQLFENAGTPEDDIANLTVSPCPTSNTPPTASFTVTPASATEPGTFTFDGSASADVDAGDSITSYAWDFDVTDAAGPVTTATATTTHSYDDHGVYTASLVVTDSHSATSSAYEVQVIVYPNQTIVFPPHYNVAGANWLQPPVIDGTVGTDTGWNECMRITHEGGTEPEMAFQGLKNRSTAATDGYLYLSFEVRNDTLMNADSVVLIGLSADNAIATPANDRLLAIYPFGAGHVPGTNLDPNRMRIWTSTAGWTDLSLASATAMNMQVKLNSIVAGASNAWDLEIRLPSNTTSGSASWIDIADNFLFYYDVIRIQSTAPVTAVEYRWPMNSPNVDGNIESYPFVRNWWTKADKTTGAITNGVWIDVANVGIQPTSSDPISSQMKLPTTTIPSVTNRFVAKVQNNTEKAIAASPFAQRIDANNVNVFFRIANWGIPSLGDWAPVPSTPNPTTSATVPGGTVGGASGDHTFESNWTLTTSDPNLANYQTNDHQCVMATINAASNVKVVKRSVYRNMDFVNASEFIRKATISGRDYGRAIHGKKHHKFFINVSKRAWMEVKDPGAKLPRIVLIKAASRDQEPDNNGQNAEEQQVDSYLEWTASGYRYNGRIIIINKTIYPISDYVGSFGYVVHHDGEVVQWETDIAGAEKTDEDSYVIEITPEKAADVITRIKPVEPPRFSISFHGGAATPLANFANDYTTGFCGIVDVGFKINDLISIVGMAGYSLIFGASSSIPSTTFVNIALDARATVPINGPMYGYIQAGPNIYIQDFSTIDFGYNGGIGAGYEFSPHLSLELGADYHSTFAQENWLLQTHAGIIIRF